MTTTVSTSIILNLSNTYGLQDDIIVIDRYIKTLQQSMPVTITKPTIHDIRQPLTHTDIQFHLEIPCYSAIPWAHVNVILVNPEQWSYAYDAYVHSFDALLFRDELSAEQFRVELEKKGITANNIFVIPWSASWQTKDVSPFYSSDKCIDEFVSFLGGSDNKYKYIQKLLPYWKETDPALTIYTTRKDHATSLKNGTYSSNVTIIQQDLDKQQRYALSAQYRGHLICSQGEAFGYAAANAEVSGAFAIMNRLPAFEYTYANLKGVAWISNEYSTSDKVRYQFASPALTSLTVREELDNAFSDFSEFLKAKDDIYTTRQQCAANRYQESCDAFLPVLNMLCKTVHNRKPSKGIFHCPPILRVEDCPLISIITPTYNRTKLIDIALHNMLVTDYPHDKIEWIVIEDNENTPHMASDKIINFQIQAPNIKVKYIPIEGRMTIGEKRNHAIENASHDIILFMDDDDHYPMTSFRRRVAWLLKGTKCGKTDAQISCCTTLPLYDLMRGISAINVPPFDIPFCQRISEATLTFKKSAWVERKFPNVSISEGEHWIQGREEQVIEMPPQQIIVAFTHGNNQSSRRVPAADMQPSCFWGFPKEYLMFIHGLVGVEIEEINSRKSMNK